jgi:hypothetical protein
MKPPGAMKRLARVYAMVEQTRSLERRVAANAVEDAACAVAIAAAVYEAQVRGGREALAQGERAEWMIAETTREMAERRITRLRAARAECDAALELAAEAHHESRLRMEQMERLLASDEDRQRVEQARQEQAVSDDRFGSRMAWKRAAAAE